MWFLVESLGKYTLVSLSKAAVALRRDLYNFGRLLQVLFQINDFFTLSRIVDR